MMTNKGGFVTSRRIASGPGHDATRLAGALASAPGDTALRRSLAEALAASGDYLPALEHYRILLGIDPRNEKSAADAGLLACRCSLEEDMLPQLRAAAERLPESARVWHVLGLMYRNLGELEPALQALNRAAQLESGNRSYAEAVASACFESGKAAADQYLELCRLYPHDRQLLLALAVALAAERRADEAVAVLESELDADAGWAEGHAALTRHRWAMGDRDGATASFQRALEEQPRNLDLWRELIIVLLHAGEFAKALEVIGRGRSVAGPHPLFDANEAVCHSELGNSAEADALFGRLAHIREPTLMMRHVRHLLRTGRPLPAERIALSMTGTAVAGDFFPYLSVAWRMTGNPLWQWLEGDPRLVGVYDLADAIPPLDAIAEILRALHVTVGQPLEQSLRGGTQTDGRILSRVEPEIRRLRGAITEAVRQHVDQLPRSDPRHPQLGRPRRPLRLGGSWSVRLTGGGFHANHYHPDGWFSSAFYVALPPSVEGGPEHAGWLALGEPQADLGIDLAPIRLIEPKPGRLVLFPSTMWHGTRPFEDGERLTIAFDVAPLG